MSPAETSRRRAIVTWLVVIYLLVLGMVVVGGITRLTGSGLSMTEWRPLMGVLPPLSEADWQAVFAQYQRSPQYQQVNDWMTLADFKAIFFWEYLHRIFGRLIGVAFFVPWLWFTIRRRLRGRLALQTLGIFVLGGLQGLLGWYMVKSGLVDRPAVSHFRLAAHLVLAFLLAHWILWVVLDQREDRPTEPAPGVFRAVAWGLVALVGVQIVWGAFMAGTRAGYMFSTFPDMNGQYVPSTLLAAESVAGALVNDPASIHFAHRTLGYLVFLGVIGLWGAGRSRIVQPERRRALDLLFGMAAVQLVLGILTVMWHVPIALAAAHQAGAFLLLSAAVLTVFRLGSR